MWPRIWGNLGLMVKLRGSMCLESLTPELQIYDTLLVGSIVNFLLATDHLGKWPILGEDLQDPRSISYYYRQGHLVENISGWLLAASFLDDQQTRRVETHITNTSLNSHKPAEVVLRTVTGKGSMSTMANPSSASLSVRMHRHSPQVAESVMSYSVSVTSSRISH